MKNQEELTLFIRKKLRGGYPHGELYNDLLKDGYPNEQLQKVFYDASVKKKEVKGNGQKSTSDFPIWFLVSSGLGITGLSLVSFKNFGFTTTGYFLVGIGIIGVFIQYILPFIKDQAEK